MASEIKAILKIEQNPHHNSASLVNSQRFVRNPGEVAYALLGLIPMEILGLCLGG